MWEAPDHPFLDPWQATPSLRHFPNPSPSPKLAPAPHSVSGQPPAAPNQFWTKQKVKLQNFRSKLGQNSGPKPYKKNQPRNGSQTTKTSNRSESPKNQPGNGLGRAARPARNGGLGELPGPEIASKPAPNRS